MNESVKYMDEQAIAQVQQGFLTKVYGWMVLGLLITGITAWYVFDSMLYVELFANSMFFWLIMFGEIALVWGISAGINKLSKASASLLFFLYSFLNGLTLSVILAVYTAESVQNVFLLSAVMFGSLSAYGYFTKKNLSAVGSFMFMGLIGVIGVSVLNIFIHSSALNFAISVIGVLVFAGLTAYDTQKLKQMSLGLSEDGELASKGAIVGALSLYLDFINLFLMLLRLFGGRR
jgi:uncharacterized protein